MTDLAQLARETRAVYLALARLGDAAGRLLALDLLARISALRREPRP